MDQILTIAGLVLPVMTYFAGVQRGKHQEKERQAHERLMEEQRNTRVLMSKIVDEYVAMSRQGKDNGPHAMARLGLHALGSDELIRQAIAEMSARTAGNAWQGASGHVEDIDLLVFFRLASERNVNFFNTSVEQHAEAVRQAGGMRTA